ncbi:hypothetical protein V6N13_114755 [Hibiscus sabdariffa]
MCKIRNFEIPKLPTPPLPLPPHCRSYAHPSRQSVRHSPKQAVASRPSQPVPQPATHTHRPQAGENIDEVEMLSSSAESSKEPKKFDGDKEHVECIYCAQKISCASANGTNAMKCHTERCKKAPFNLEKTQTILDFESKTKCNADGTIETVSVPKLWRFDQEKIREALAKMVILDELPFSFVEREGFHMFCKIAIPDFILPSRTSNTRDCYALFIEKRRTLKNFFKNLSSRVYLTTYTWTYAQNLSYMCLTANFIDNTWKLHKMIINFCPIDGHSGELIGRAVEKCLLEWGLKRILTVFPSKAAKVSILY